MFMIIHARKNLIVKTKKNKYGPASTRFFDPPCRVEVKLVALYLQVGVLKVRLGLFSQFLGTLTLSLRWLP